jgi:hypothetical protein
VATIIRGRELIILCVKHLKFNRGLMILFLVLMRSTGVGGVHG